MANNYIIVTTGRGASYAFMLTCDEDEVTARCQPSLHSGMECYIYKIEPSPLGKPGFAPEGAINLRRIWHLYAAHEEFKQEAKDIISRLDCHSTQSSIEYLDIMISELQREFEALKGGQHGKQSQVVEGETGEVHGNDSSKEGQAYVEKVPDDFHPGTAG